VTGLCVIDGVVVDPVAGPVLLDVLAAALGAFDEAPGAVAPCAAGVVAGAAAAVDRGLDTADGCCGQLWVRLVSLYPSRTFPDPDGRPTDAGSVSWAVVVEVGSVRPAPIVREEGERIILPSMDEEQEAAWVAVTDQAVLRYALLTRYAEDREVQLVLGTFTPFGPEGGVVGGALTATIQIL
jgi:hypothetical protein